MSRASIREGSSSAICRRLRSSRQERPASTRMRVRLLETSVLFPLEPEASTVIRIILQGYALALLIPQAFSTGKPVAVPHWETGLALHSCAIAADQYW